MPYDFEEFDVPDSEQQDYLVDAPQAPLQSKFARSAGGKIPNRTFDLAYGGVRPQVVKPTPIERADERTDSKYYADRGVENLQDATGQVIPLSVPIGDDGRADPQALGAAQADAELLPSKKAQEAQAKADAKAAASEFSGLRKWKTAATTSYAYHAKNLKDFDKGEGADLDALKYQVSELQNKAQEKVGALRGALSFDLHAGDPTPEATQAQKDLAEKQAQLDALSQKRQRLASMADRAKAVYDEARTKFHAANDDALGVTQPVLDNAAATLNAERDPAQPKVKAPQVGPPPDSDYTPGDWVQDRIRQVNADRASVGRTDFIDPRTMSAYNPNTVKQVGGAMSIDPEAVDQQAKATAEQHDLSPEISTTLELGKLKASGATHVGAVPIDKMIDQYGGTDAIDSARLLQTYQRAKDRISAIDEMLPNMTERAQKPLQDERAVLSKVLDEKEAAVKQRGLWDEVRDPTTTEKVEQAAANVAGGAGRSLLDIPEFVGRQAVRLKNALSSPQNQTSLDHNSYQEYLDAMKDVTHEWGPDVPAAVKEKLAKNFVVNDIASGVGSLGGMLIPGATVGRIARLANLGATAAGVGEAGTMMLAGSASTANSLRDEVNQANAGIRAKLDDQLANGEITKAAYDKTVAQMDRQAGQAEALGAGLGLTLATAEPLAAMFGRMMKVPAGKLFAKTFMDRAMQGDPAAVAEFMNGTGGKLLNKTLDSLGEGGGFALQQFGQTLAENAAASGHLGITAWDPNRKIVDENSLKGAASGLVLGFLTRGVKEAYSAKYGEPPSPASAAAEPTTPTPDAGGAAPAPEANAAAPTRDSRTSTPAPEPSASPVDATESNQVPVHPDLAAELSREVVPETNAPTSAAAETTPADRATSDVQPQEQPAAAEKADLKPLPAEWQVTVQEGTKDAPGYVQVDKIGPDGHSEGSVSPEALKAEGYAVPDFTELKQGQYRVADLPDQSRTRMVDSQAAETASSPAIPASIESKAEPALENASPEAEKQAGEPINKNWTAFSPESQSLGIPRAEMPQVKAEHRGALVQFLKGRDIMSEDTDVFPTELKPTQNEFSPEKVEQARKFEGGDRAILVSQDNYVVDGHHQWMAKLADEPTTPMRVIRIDAPIRDVLEQIKEFPSAERASGATKASPSVSAGDKAQPQATNPVEAGPTGSTPGRSGSDALVGGSEAKDTAGAPAPVSKAADEPSMVGPTVAQLHKEITSNFQVTKRGERALRSVLQRLNAANPEAFSKLHVVYKDELGGRMKGSPAGYDPTNNVLYLAKKAAENYDDDIVKTIVHEGGHFAEKFYLGEGFTQSQWEKLSDQQRSESWRQYSGETKNGADLKNDRVARSEWVSFQFARVIRGDVDGMSPTMVQKLRAFLDDMRAMVHEWYGDKKLTTPELDGKILEMLGYKEKPKTENTSQTAADAAQPEWMRQNITQMVSEADRAGISDRIEELAAQGLNAKDIARSVGTTAEIVRAVRAKRGIPSLDQTTEFNAWRDARAKEEPVSVGAVLLAPKTAESANAETEKESRPKAEKPAPVPGKPGWFYRSTPDSLRENGMDVARQVYERRGHKAADEVASSIVDTVGEKRAADIAISREQDGVPADVRTMIYGQLLARKAERIADPKTTPADRAQARREIQQLQAIKPAQYTERGQEISALQQVYKNVRAAAMSEYTDSVASEQNRRLGPEGKKAIDDATKAISEADAKAIDDATKALDRSLKKVPLTKSLWDLYRQDAANRMLSFVDSKVTPAKDKAPLQEFTNRVVDAMRQAIESQLPEKEKSSRPEPSAADLLREAVENKEKYADVISTVQKEFAAKYGEGSPMMDLIDTELSNLGVRPYTQKLLDRAIREAHNAMQTNVRELAKQHFTQTDAKAKDLADGIVKFAGIPEADATKLADDLTARVKELVSDARKAAVDRLRKQAQTTAQSAKVLNAVDRTVLLNNIGALTEPDLRSLVAKRIGIPEVSDEKMQRIAQLAGDVETAKNLAEKSRAQLDLANELRVTRGFAKMELATSVWYANMLSGYTTQFANSFSNVLNGVLQLGTVMATNPGHGGRALRGYVDGFGTGWQDFKSIMKTGRGLRDFDAKTGSAGSALELVDYKRDFPDLNKVIAEGLNKHAAALKYVFRAMKAADAVFYYPAKEAYTRVAVAQLLGADYKGKELDQKIRETLRMSPQEYARAEAQATNEGMEGLDKALRVASIIEERRRSTEIGAKASDQGEQFGLETTYNNDPEGWAGVLYHHLEQLTNSVRPGGIPVFKAFLPFLRIPTNIFNASLNYTPMGAMRAWRGMVVPKQSGARTEIVRKTFTQTQRARLLVQSIGGSLAMAGIYALATNNQEDGKEPWFTITATGPSDFGKRQQLEATGWRPHSMKFGDTWVTYKDTPLLLPLAIIGNMVDAQRYQKTRDDLTFGSRAVDSAMRGARVIFDTSMLSGLANLMDFVQDRASGDKVGRFLSRIPADLLVPYSNLLRQIDRTFDPHVHEANGPAGTFGASVPFLRRTGDVKTDVLGQPVQSSAMSRFGGVETNDPLREALRDKNVFISTPSRSTKVGKRVMTPEEYRAFVKISGDEIRQRLTPQVGRIRALDPEHAEKFVDKVRRDARNRAKAIVGRGGRPTPSFDLEDD